MSDDIFLLPPSKRPDPLGMRSFIRRLVDEGHRPREIYVAFYDAVEDALPMPAGRSGKRKSPAERVAYFLDRRVNEAFTRTKINQGAKIEARYLNIAMQVGLNESFVGLRPPVDSAKNAPVYTSLKSTDLIDTLTRAGWERL